MLNDNLSAEQLAGDVHPLLHALRSHSPVAWVPAIDRWVVTARALVLEAMRDVERFTVDDPRFTTAQVVGPSMLSLDGNEHARHREPFAIPFRRSATERNFADSTHACAEALVASLGGSTADLRSELAAPLAASTITDALGLVDTTTEDLLGWYRQIVDAVEAVTVGDEPARGVAEAFNALGEAVRRSVAVPASLMARIDADADLTADELVSNTAVMLFGAIETSEGMTANALVHVLQDRGVVEQLLADPTLIDAAVEESLRLEPAATLVDRYVTAETTLGDVTLPAGAAVALSLAGANRDPAHFPEPDRFDLDRANAGHHLSFVHGPHACIGMHLARLETRAALQAVLALNPVPVLVDPVAAQPVGLVFRKPLRVDVTLA